jgi:hypothetical protein
MASVSPRPGSIRLSELANRSAHSSSANTPRADGDECAPVSSGSSSTGGRQSTISSLLTSSKRGSAVSAKSAGGRKRPQPEDTQSVLPSAPFPAFPRLPYLRPSENQNRRTRRLTSPSVDSLDSPCVSRLLQCRPTLQRRFWLVDSAPRGRRPDGADRLAVADQASAVAVEHDRAASAAASPDCLLSSGSTGTSPGPSPRRRSTASGDLRPELVLRRRAV